jgi:hypothetical protein
MAYGFSLRTRDGSMNGNGLAFIPAHSMRCGIAGKQEIAHRQRATSADDRQRDEAKPRCCDTHRSEECGMSVVAISWDKSENRLANPMPSTVRFSQRTTGWLYLRLGVEGGAFIAAKGCLQKAAKAPSENASSKRLSAVDKKRRLRIMMALGPSISRPGSPLQMASGRRPKAVTSAVMKIRLNLSGALLVPFECLAERWAFALIGAGELNVILKGIFRPLRPQLPDP